MCALPARDFVVHVKATFPRNVAGAVGVGGRGGVCAIELANEKHAQCEKI